MIGFAGFAASFALLRLYFPIGIWLGFSGMMAPLVCAVAAAMIAMAMAGLIVIHRLQRGNRRIYAALDNMSEGLCMFDARERLLVCNQRYRELYNLPADMTKRGGTLQAVLDHRIANGSFARDPLEYRREILRDAREPRHARGSHVPRWNRDFHQQSADRRRGLGGDARGHHRAARCRARTRRMQEQQQRRGRDRAGDRRVPPRVEDHLRRVADGAQAMRSTAATLFANSGRLQERRRRGDRVERSLTNVGSPRSPPTN